MKGQRERICGLLLVLLLAGCAPGVQPGATASPVAESPALPETSRPAETTPVSIAPKETTNVSAPELETLATDLWRLEYEKLDRLKLDIAIPRVSEELGGAADLNAQIEAEYAFYLDRELEEYEFQMGFAAPYIHIWYEVYRWDGFFELCIFGRMESLWGSGPALWTSVYGYDLEADKVLSAEELLEKLGYTPEDVVNRFYETEVWEEDPESYTWESIRDGKCFYVDEVGKLAFTVSLYA